MKAIERQTSLHALVVQSIKSYITENQLQAGDPLPSETEFARVLGVGRNSVREAIKALESLGIIETRHGIGIFVKSFSFEPIIDNLQFALMEDLKQLSDLLEIREILEAGILEKVVFTISVDDLEKLRSILSRMREKAYSGGPIHEEDREFHQAMLQSAGNEILLKLLDTFWLLFSRTSQYAQLEDEYPKQTYQDHVVIIDSLVTRDLQAARKALSSHYYGIRHRLELAKGKFQD